MIYRTAIYHTSLYVSGNFTVATREGAVLFSGLEPNVYRGYIIKTNTGTHRLTGYAPELHDIGVNIGAIVITGLKPTISRTDYNHPRKTKSIRPHHFTSRI